MNITHENLENLRTGFQTSFNQGLAVAAPVGGPLATEVTSTTKLETYGFLGDMPIFRKWIGDKKIKSLQEKAYILANEDFEASWGIHKNKIRDDSLGLYGPMVQGWGKDAGALPDRLKFDALRDGHLRPCFDGQNYFDDEHPGTIRDPGDPTGFISGVWSNMSGNNAVAPYFLVDLSKPLKPLIYQKRQAPTFDMVTDMSDSHVFKTGEYLMGGEARGAAGYTFPQLAHRLTAAPSAAAYEAAYQAMTSLLNDEGEPAEIKPTHVVFGSSNRAAIKRLFEAMLVNGGDSNIYYKDIELIEAPRLA